AARHGYSLLESRADAAAKPNLTSQRINGAVHQIVRTRRQRCVSCLQKNAGIRRSGKFQRVAQRNRLKNRPQFVVTIRPASYHVQAKVNFRERRKTHGPFLARNHAGELTAVSRNPGRISVPDASSAISIALLIRLLCRPHNRRAPPSATLPALVRRFPPPAPSGRASNKRRQDD